MGTSPSGGHPLIRGPDKRERCARKRSEAEREGCARSNLSCSAPVRKACAGSGRPPTVRRMGQIDSKRRALVVPCAAASGRFEALDRSSGPTGEGCRARRSDRGRRGVRLGHVLYRSPARKRSAWAFIRRGPPQCGGRSHRRRAATRPYSELILCGDLARIMCPLDHLTLMF